MAELLLSVTDDLGLTDRRAVGRDDPHAPALEVDADGEAWLLTWSPDATGEWYRTAGIFLGYLDEEAARDLAAALQICYLAGIDSEAGRA